MTQLKLLFEAEAGEPEAKTGVQFALYGLGRDFLLVVSGGETHIGSVTVTDQDNDEAAYHQMSLIHHREEIVAQRVIERLGKSLKNELLVTVGIHYDDINKEQILAVLDNCDHLIEKTAAFFKTLGDGAI